MPPYQTWTALVCVALLGCATGVEDLDWVDEPVVDGVPVVDASTAPPPIIPSDPGTAPVIPPIVINYDSGSPWSSDPGPTSTSDAAAGGSTPDSSGSGQGGASTDAATSQPVTPPATADAATGGSTPPDAGTPPSSSLDAGTKPVDAGYTPPEAAPMCQASTCTNYCALARRCCNASNQCACMSLLGTCTLPSLRP